MTKLLIAALLAAAAQAQAGTVQVFVTDKDGKPAADVVVLIETPQRPAPRPAAAPVVIEQKDLRFVPFLTVVPVGSTVRFVNQDAYDHHVRSTPSGPLGAIPAASPIELRLDAAAGAAAPANEYQAAPARPRSGQTSAEVKLPSAGAIGLGCHIHGSMRGQIYVAATPWFGKTDANGAVSIDGVPEGNAEMTLWHADQLSEQPIVRLVVGAAALRSENQLNFTPRRRRN